MNVQQNKNVFVSFLERCLDPRQVDKAVGKLSGYGKTAESPSKGDYRRNSVYSISWHAANFRLWSRRSNRNPAPKHAPHQNTRVHTKNHLKPPKLILLYLA